MRELLTVLVSDDVAQIQQINPRLFLEKVPQVIIEGLQSRRPERKGRLVSEHDLTIQTTTLTLWWPWDHYVPSHEPEVKGICFTLRR